MGVARLRVVTAALPRAGADGPTIAFVQPFGARSPGGGPRILRALFEAAPARVVSICTSPAPPPATSSVAEVHLPARPHFGRVESTRFGRYLGYAELAHAGRFRTRLETVCREQHAEGIHALAHGLDFWPALQVARRLGVPYYLSVHDDVMYALQGSPVRSTAASHVAEAWREADARFVISDAMGREYDRRHGARSYTTVTDGLSVLAPAGRAVRPDRLHVYFMGLLHLSYHANVLALLDALAEIRRRRPEVDVRMTFRCGALPAEFSRRGVPVVEVPFGTEADVARDLEQADVLYLPLPFGAEYEAFVRFSLSTKLVTYLGTGIPILYHGPEDSAAGRLLATHDAACGATSLEASDVGAAVDTLYRRGAAVGRNALALARAEFRLEDQQRRFWGAIVAGAGEPPPADAVGGRVAALHGR